MAGGMPHEGKQVGIFLFICFFCFFFFVFIFFFGKTWGKKLVYKR
jgi:hypothetical protein